MCDTMVALGNATLDGTVIFAKNSDRQPNEPLLLIRVPRKKYISGSKVKCTYIEIDQVAETFEVLLLKPSWMWGAEMGANEYGLNIGNEAVFTREKHGSEALLGMDMLRLALERCRNSEEALALIVELLEKYGQGGNCGYEKKFFYHNSFLIADPCSAWVLETAGEYWAAEKVKDVRSISNRLSIGSRFDRSHSDLIKHAIDKGWCKSEADFNFARCYSDPLMTRFSGSLQRQKMSGDMLKREKGRITMQTMRSILRSHEEGLEGQQFTKHSLKSVCMHGGFLYGDHTTGSYIVSLHEKRPTYLITSGSTPCLALYKPFWMINDESFSFREGEGKTAVNFWLRRERLHRFVLENKISSLQTYLTERDLVEREIDCRLAEIDSDLADEPLLKGIITEALAAEEKLLDETFAQIENPRQPGKIRGNPYFRWYWKKQNEKLFSRYRRS
ncbi:MAG: C69 family dipeptidase [Bacillota bacterium]|nr:C69 family dipeptidase [Bacillota bacterium]